MLVRPWVRGLLSFLPGFERWWSKQTGGGQTLSPRYCYSVWLRHLVKAHDSGLSTDPSVVAELGPGESIGVGIAAVLCGADSYHAFDVIKYANPKRNLAVFDVILALLRERAPIPNDLDLTEVQPSLQSYAFPSEVLSDKRLDVSLAPQRIRTLRHTLGGPASGQHPHRPFSYITSWLDTERIDPETIDLIISQAVLEHVDDLSSTYRAMYQWLRPGGFMSHQIDFRCHGITRDWNGHWAISDSSWSIIRGKRAYFLNRAPYETHVAHLREAGFEIVREQRACATGGISRSRLSRRFKSISDLDLSTCGVFVQARKPVRVA
jgi:SAM-dependent methyltransferase